LLWAHPDRIIFWRNTKLTMSAIPAYVEHAKPGPTVSKAVVRAAELLGINQATLSDVLGLSRASTSRLVAGNYLLDPGRSKEWEFALLFLRAFRSLDAVVGHGDRARAWLRGANLALGGVPAELIRSAEGLVRTVHYLDAARGRI
jgi:hypothetical protein